MKLFRQIISELFRPDAVELKVGALTLKYTEQMRDDLARVIGLIRSKRVLFADIDHEIWEHVFASLKQVLEDLRALEGTLERKGPHDVKNCLVQLIDAIAAYLAEHEASYIGFMEGPWLPGLIGRHREANWPALAEAADDLIRLRLIMSRALKNLALFANDGAISDWAEQPARAASHWAQYARNRRLCSTCGWNLNQKRAKCPYDIAACPSYDPADTGFEHTAVGALSVAVSGTFSNWQPIALEQVKYGYWVARLRIPPGLHQYKFVVDGVWVTDPSNPHKENDGSGNVNSILLIAKTSALP